MADFRYHPSQSLNPYYLSPPPPPRSYTRPSNYNFHHPPFNYPGFYPPYASYTSPCYTYPSSPDNYQQPWNDFVPPPLPKPPDMLLSGQGSLEFGQNQIQIPTQLTKVVAPLLDEFDNVVNIHEKKTVQKNVFEGLEKLKEPYASDLNDSMKKEWDSSKNDPGVDLLYGEFGDSTFSNNTNEEQMKQIEDEDKNWTHQLFDKMPEDKLFQQFQENDQMSDIKEEIQLPETEGIMELLQKSEAACDKCSKVLSGSLSLENVEKLLHEFDNISINIPELNVLRQYHVDTLSWIARFNDIMVDVSEGKDQRKQMSDLSFLLRDGSSLGIQVKGLSLALVELKKASCREKAQRVFTARRSLKFIEQLLAEAAALHIEEERSFVEISGILSSARCWEESASNILAGDHLYRGENKNTEVLKTSKKITSEKAIEVEIAGKASHDIDDGAKQLEKKKQNPEDAFANMQDAFETLLSHDLSDHQKKLRTEIDVEDVRRKVEIMRCLPKHPNIVSFKEASEDKDAVYLVMEICEGGELFDRIVSRGHYTECAAASVSKTIHEVVKVCHEHGVIHRDLKPENFLFSNATETAQLKTIDFGLSIFFKPTQRFNEIVGSPYYMAPEVLRRNYGHEIDVWSAGVILYILLCGIPPFWAETEEGIAHAIVRGNIDFERDPWPKVSSEAKDLVKNILDANPYSRLTVQEVLEHPGIQNAERAPNVNLGENVRTKIQHFLLMNRFKKKVLQIVADNPPNEEIAAIVQIFLTMNTDKNGHLAFEELRDGLQNIGQVVPDGDVKMLMDATDTDGNGTLSCDKSVTMFEVFHIQRPLED